MKRSLRFAVLYRDEFTCQYCGASAPDAVLEVDHVLPRSAGGPDRLSNLVTACYDCNRGKKDRFDTSGVLSYRRQLHHADAAILELGDQVYALQLRIDGLLDRLDGTSRDRLLSIGRVAS